MPIITRTFLKSALLCFVASLVAGMMTALRPLVETPRFVDGLTPVYFHLFMVGWVTQLIIGIAYWMFPKHTKERPRGHDWLAWTTFALLNVDLFLRVIAETAQTTAVATEWGWALALSAALQWVAGMAFVVNTWPRVKAR
jgi:hypothetical protein